MRLILSPHLDDAALSLGAVIHRWVRIGEPVVVLNLCAGTPRLATYSRFARELHARWGFAADVAVQRRRVEDRRALRILGATGVYWRSVDCVYRRDRRGRWLYPSVQAIFGELHVADQPLALIWAVRLRRLVRRLGAAQVYAPLGLGRHVDHQLTRLAAERSGLPLVYYEDYPYAQWQTRGANWAGLAVGLRAQPMRVRRRDVDAKLAAIRAYPSQISSLWPSETAMATAFETFHRVAGGWRETVWETGSLR
jgi:LmbE family N-acetylglucosaminyl deacetylase